MQLPLRIAILETDTPLENAHAKYGGYGGVVKAILDQGARSMGRNPETVYTVTSYDIVDDPDNYPDLHELDAILITGSKYDAFESTPWIIKLVDFTKKVLAQRVVRLIGICFGHQIVGRAMGVRVGRGNEWEIAVCNVNLSQRGVQLFGREKLRIQQMHRDVVFACPEGVEEWGSSPACKVQGMYEAKRLFTIQGHPEFNEEIMREILERWLNAGIFNEEAYNQSMKKIGLPHDGVVVAQAFIRFLLD